MKKPTTSSDKHSLPACPQLTCALLVPDSPRVLQSALGGCLHGAPLYSSSRSLTAQAVCWSEGNKPAVPSSSSLNLRDRNYGFQRSRMTYPPELAMPGVQLDQAQRHLEPSATKDVHHSIPDPRRALEGGGSGSASAAPSQKMQVRDWANLHGNHNSLQSSSHSSKPPPSRQPLRDGARVPPPPF